MKMTQKIKHSIYFYVISNSYTLDIHTSLCNECFTYNIQHHVSKVALSANNADRPSTLRRRDKFKQWHTHVEEIELIFVQIDILKFWELTTLCFSITKSRDITCNYCVNKHFIRWHVLSYFIRIPHWISTAVCNNIICVQYYLLLDLIIPSYSGRRPWSILV